MRKSKHVNREVMSFEISHLLQCFGINMPFLLEVLRTFICHWVKALHPSELEKYSIAIQMAKRAGRHAKKMLKRLTLSCNENEVKILESLFTGFLIASMFMPEMEVREND